MKDKLILIEGGGSIGKRHINNLHKLGFSNLYCLKRNPDINFEKEFNVKVITDYNQLSHKPFAVFICNPTSLHISSLEKAVKNNAHVFMEKPLTYNRKEWKKAKTLLTNYNQTFFIGFMLRYHPLVKEIHNIIRNEKLGKVFSARFEFGSYLPYWHPYEDYHISYAARKELGGGVIHTITHELDLILHYFGIPNEVSAHKMNLNKLQIDVEEIFEGTFIYEDKIVTLHLDYLQKDYDRRISILFDEGSLRWNWHENMIVIKKHKKTEKKIKLENFDVNKLYIDELIDFFKIIEKKETKKLDKETALINSDLALRLHEAAETKKNVPIKNIDYGTYT